MSNHPALTPFTLASTTLPNRLAVSLMTRVSARADGTLAGARRGSRRKNAAHASAE